MDYDYRPFLYSEAYVLSTDEKDPRLVALLHDDCVNKTSKMITHKVSKFNLVDKPIVVPDNLVRQAIEYYYINQYIYFINKVFNIPEILETVADGYVQQIIDDFNQEHANDKLDIWITRYDNTKGLRRHAQVKIKEKQINVPISFSNRY